jgi:hypothetical protein
LSLSRSKWLFWTAYHNQAQIISYAEIFILHLNLFSVVLNSLKGDDSKLLEIKLKTLLKVLVSIV